MIHIIKKFSSKLVTYLFLLIILKYPVNVNMQTKKSTQTLLPHHTLELQIARHDQFGRQNLRPITK